MATYQSPLVAIVKGAIAGAAGTWAMGKAMSLPPQYLSRAGIQLPDSPPGPTAPDSPTEALAERVAEGVARAELDPDAKRVGGQAIHWGYGAAWGSVYAILPSTFKRSPLRFGAVFGLLVGTVADTAVPAMRLQNWPTERPMALNVYYMAAHVVYGAAVALVYAVLNVGRRG